ncbi:alpha/beta hydrolase [Mycolicibacterium sp. XJ870]
MRRVAAALISVLLLAGCGSDEPGWTDTDVSFDADGLTIHGSYRHDGKPGPAALMISESGPTDRNGDNKVVGPVGNMRQLAEALSDKGVSSLRYDKIGTGKTGLGPYESKPTEVVSGVYTTGATAALRFLADQPDTDDNRISVYALGEGAVHAMSLAAAGDPKVHALALFQPLAGRYLDIITNRVRAGATPEVLTAWLAAVDEIRTKGTVPAKLPEGLGAIVNPGNLNAIIEADKIDPLPLAAELPDGMPVLLTCSDSDAQANCAAERPLIDALKHTALTVVELKGVNHILRDDPTDSIANYSKPAPLSPQVLDAVNGFVDK